jgi:hypothetical protein
MENLTNLGLFVVLTIVSEYAARKVCTHIQRICRKDLSVHGEDTKRLLAYSPNTPRDVKLIIFYLKLPNKEIFRSFIFVLYGFE